MSQKFNKAFLEFIRRPFTKESNRSGVTLVELMIAGTIFSISLLAAYRGLDSAMMSKRADKSRLKMREVESFIQNNVWRKVADYANSSLNFCSVTMMSATPPYPLFPTGFTSLGAGGQFKFIRRTAIFAAMPGNAEQIAARARCANSLNDVTATDNGFYACLVFKKDPAVDASTGSVWYNLGENTDDNKVFAEVWVSYRHATDPSNNTIQCQDFGQLSESGYIGFVSYSIYIAEKAKRAAGLDAWIFKRLDGVTYATRPY